MGALFKVAVLAGSAAALGIAGLLGWLRVPVPLATGSVRSIPMAPVTAIAVLLLSIASLALAAGRARRVVAAAGAIICLFALGRLLMFAANGSVVPDLEGLFAQTSQYVGTLALAPMSPMTAVGLAVLGAAVATLATTSRRRARDAAGGLGTVAGLLGAAVVLGYAYGTPLLYRGAVVPVALSTSLALCALAGAVVIVAAGAEHDGWPTRVFSGNTARARLLRVFVPSTTAAFLIASAGGQALVLRLNTNPALATALSTLAAAGLVAALVSWTARTVGNAIDQAERELRQSQQSLEDAVTERTRQLTRSNEELEAFSYSVSHDLRAPLRHISGFAALLQRSAGGRLGDQDRRYMQTIVDAGARMSGLIDDLLSFSRMARSNMLRSTVDLGTLVDEVVAEAARDANGRTISWTRQPLPTVLGDRAMLRTALVNLVANAVKYTSTRARAEIEIGSLPDADGESILFVRDNGVGFDMQYADKLFGVFQRLHASEEFAGTGIGLAHVRRVVGRHGGRTWAEGAVNDGATFYVALPEQARAS
jgi:signal transduction histidine kinase